MPTIRRIDIPQTVRVRKYEVGCELLRNLLRAHKKTCWQEQQGHCGSPECTYNQIRSLV